MRENSGPVGQMQQETSHWLLLVWTQVQRPQDSRFPSPPLCLSFMMVQSCPSASTILTKTIFLSLLQSSSYRIVLVIATLGFIKGNESKTYVVV